MAAVARRHQVLTAEIDRLDAALDTLVRRAGVKAESPYPNACLFRVAASTTGVGT